MSRIAAVNGDKSRRLPGLVDVARHAGVSVPTVSRYLSGSTPVSEEKRSLIAAAIRDLGYRPNGAARALVNGWQPLIAVLSGNTDRYGFATTLQGIEDEAQRAGYLIAITVLHSDDQEKVRESINLALGQPVAGVIVIDFDRVAAFALEQLPAAIPTVTVASHHSRIQTSSVQLDDERGSRVATEYLLSLGHATVHHVAINARHSDSGRLAGWEGALREAGVAVPRVVDAGWTAESGYEAGLKLGQDLSVTAILCGNDELAFGLIRALETRGRSVPRDVSVVGFDDHPHARFWQPALTTVRQDFFALGARAVRILIGEKAPASTRDASILDTLIVRDSTAAPATTSVR